MPFKKLRFIIDKIKHHSPILLCSGIGLLLIISLCILSIMFSIPHETQHMKVSAQQLEAGQKQVFLQLRHLEEQVAQFTTQVDKVGISHEAIQSLNQQLTTLQNKIDYLSKQTDKATIQKTIAEENQKLSDQLDHIQSQLEQLKKHSTASHQLSAPALPFHVIGIDIWNGQSMATIKVGNAFSLMAINESHAGWTLTDIDFDASCVMFKNAKNQFVKVKL